MTRRKATRLRKRANAARRQRLTVAYVGRYEIDGTGKVDIWRIAVPRHMMTGAA